MQRSSGHRNYGHPNGNHLQNSDLSARQQPLRRMLFNSLPFFLFLGIVLLVYLRLSSAAKKTWLLLASYVFYGLWDERFLALLWLSTLVDFQVGRQLDRTEAPAVRRRWLALSLAVNLSLLGIFKYFDFFQSSLIELMQLFGVALDPWTLRIILPVGISFYTFQTLSYTIDIYRRELRPVRSLQDFALFVAFFPQLVAGPIERAKRLLPQLQTLQNPSREQWRDGLYYMVVGLAMKMLLGDTAGHQVDCLYADLDAQSTVTLSLGAFLFAIQVYCDFAGYSLVARGVAKWLGVELMVNFKQPMVSTNYAEFWRRWHISLYHWFRVYVYFPLGGSRRSEWRNNLNILIVMSVSGLWHGASSSFILWGFLNGLVLCFERWKARTWGVKPLHRWARPLYIVLVMVVFSGTCVFFRSGNWATTLDWWQAWAQGMALPTDIRVAWTALVCGIGLYALEIPYARAGGDAAWARHWPAPLRYGVGVALIGFLLLSMAIHKPEPFIYFQF